MRKFSHRPATLVNRERPTNQPTHPRPPLFFSSTYSRTFTYLTKRNRRLWDFTSPRSGSRRENPLSPFLPLAHLPPPPRTTTVPLHRPSFSRFRCPGTHPLSFASHKGGSEGEKKSTALLLIPFAPRLGGTRSNYRARARARALLYTFSFLLRLLSPVSFVATIAHEARRGWFISARESRGRGWRG